MDASRRTFLTAALGAAAAPQLRPVGLRDQALIAITLDLEMSRNFPNWEDTHWDYEKGNLNEETKRYTVEACRRVKEHGGVLHCFMLGRTLEQERVDWLEEIIGKGHPIGNHTYDHVNVLATREQDIQFRFQRAPWLIAGQVYRDVIRRNIEMAGEAMHTRLGIAPAGFRTPGGFVQGLADRADLQLMLRDLGYSWVSSKYPRHVPLPAGVEPTPAVMDAIVGVQSQAQPFVYPSGLVEIPMSPVSDINAFRIGRWQLSWYLRAIQAAVEWCIERRAVFDFLAHPSCLYVMDPEFRAIELICQLVQRSRGRAAIVSLETIARRVVA